MPPKTALSRLAQSAYSSPFSHRGAPEPHPNTDPYTDSRKLALNTLLEMGYDPKTMVEKGVTWAEDQDPFGHVAQARYMHFLGLAFHRVMESYDECLSESEYKDMINGRTVIPAVRKFEVDIRRQVTYPDSLIIAYRQEQTEPTRNGGTTTIFSLTQQAIVAQCTGTVTYMSAQTGRPIDIRTVGGGWPDLYEALLKKCTESNALKEKWELKNRKARM
ncbi:hypothetical protein GGR57DRAFT_492799 [Xylariaceae sp. FL1272]|nr:hypothetical protein GGR57DRAFT_492799 [Xylariaceae sp. FL1272]